MALLQKLIRERLGGSALEAEMAVKHGRIPYSRILDEYGMIDEEKAHARRLLHRVLQKERRAKLRERLRTHLENQRRKAPHRNAYLDPRTSSWWTLWIDGDQEDLKDPTHNRAQLFRRQFRVPYTFFRDLVRFISLFNQS